MSWLLIPLAIVAGMATPLQAGCNSMLEKIFDRPLLVVTISIVVSLAAMVVGDIAFGHFALPSAQTVERVPWWAWLGGLCGALVLLSQPIVAPRLGGAVYIGLFVTASTITSVLLDHFGLLGFAEHPAGAGRIAGCVLMVAGIALVTRY